MRKEHGPIRTVPSITSGTLSNYPDRQIEVKALKNSLEFSLSRSVCMLRDILVKGCETILNIECDGVYSA